MVRSVMSISRRFSAGLSGRRLASRSCSRDERFTIFAPAAELDEDDATAGVSDATGGTATAEAGRCSTN